MKLPKLLPFAAALAISFAPQIEDTRSILRQEYKKFHYFGDTWTFVEEADKPGYYIGIKIKGRGKPVLIVRYASIEDRYEEGFRRSYKMVKEIGVGSSAAAPRGDPRRRIHNYSFLFNSLVESSDWPNGTETFMDEGVDGTANGTDDYGWIVEGEESRYLSPQEADQRIYELVSEALRRQ